MGTISHGADAVGTTVEPILQQLKAEDGAERPRPVGITEVLPANMFRRTVVPQGDVVFPWLEPILAFGGVSSYFLMGIAAHCKFYGVTVALAAFQMLCLRIGNAEEGSALLRRARGMYLALARRALPTLTFLDPVPPHQGATRPRVLLLLPHGLYGIAAKRYCSEATFTGRQPGMSFFVDDKLCALSPPMKASARLCGASKIYPVGDRHVRTAMKNKENCVVFPGGFIEATCTSRSCLRLYTGVYGYWMSRCIENGYDIEVAHIYHGSEVWDQGEAFFDTRVALARKGAPGILPTYPTRTPLVVRELFYSPPQLEPGPELTAAAKELSATIVKDLVSYYEKDATRVLELTGKTLKRLEVIGKPLKDSVKDR